MGLNEGDIRRIIWTFIMAAGAVVVAQLSAGNDISWRAVLVGAIAAGFSAVKNLVLPDSSSLK